MNNSQTLHKLCNLDDIPENGCRGFKPDNNTTLEASIFVVRQSQETYLYQNRCPHLGLPLEWMPDQFLDRDGCYIQCATHGALFRIQDGVCIAGPCPGETLVPVPFQIQGKSIMINKAFLEAET